MKILSVRLKNINSLRGEHFIPFNKSPFVESGLFAITGSTGAGKSSILDAITLALYGCAPRFDNDKPFEIMSYHTSDCMAEVEFESNEKIYRSKWSIHRSRGKLEGEIQSPKMELVDVVKDTIIESKKTEVINKIIEITGLDYFRFLRSVMLAQGEFAAFLKADKNERGELLEKITGTDIYTKISKRAFEKQKEKKQRLEQLECQMDASRLLSDEQKENYQQQIIENKEKNAAISREIEVVTAQLQWLQTLAQLQAKAVSLKSELAEVYQQKELHKPDFEKYNRHIQALPFQVPYREVFLLEKQVGDLTQDIQNIRSSLPLLERARNEAATAVSSAKQALDHAKQAYVASAPVMDQVIGLDKDLDNLREQFKKIHSELTALSHEITTYQAEKSDYQSRLTSTLQEQAKIKTYLEEHEHDVCLESDIGLLDQNIQILYGYCQEIAAKETAVRQLTQSRKQLAEKLSAIKEEEKKHTTTLKWTEAKIRESNESIQELLDGLTIEDIEATVQELHQKTFTRGNQIRFSKSFVENTEQINDLQMQIEENQQQANQKRASLKILQEKENQAEREMELLQRLFETQHRFVSYEAARQELSPGQPCPLCGSTHHPLATQDAEAALGQTERERHSAKQLADSLRSQVQAEHTWLNELEAKQRYVIKDLSTKSLEIATLEKEFELMNRQLKENNNIHQPHLIAQKQDENIAEQKRLQQILQLYREKNKSLTIYQQQRENDQKSLQQIEKQLLELQLAEENAGKELQKNHQDKEKISHDHTKLRAELENRLLTYQLSIPAEDHFSQWMAGLKKRQDTFKKYVEKEKAIGEEINKLRLEIEKLESALREKEKYTLQVENEKNQLLQKGKALGNRRKELFGDKKLEEEKERLNQAIEQNERLLQSAEAVFHEKQESLTVRQQQLADQSRVLEKIQHNYRDKERGLLSQLLDAGFADIAHFQSSLLDAATEDRIKRRKESIEEKLNSVKGALAQNEKELKEQGAKELTEAGIPEVQQSLQKANAEKEALIAHTAQIEQILRENEKIQERYSLLTISIEKQRQEYNRWKILSDMIGSASGAEFNVFAQGLTLARLVQLANKYLDKLNPRYQIRRKPHTDLELEITDRYQADNIRTMKTLSGGETFLVSLSLALGLSDLAGNKTRIDSLFIDEGFGTLDPQTLDTAITTLENLQATGKMIGIISHVDALKERITTQIQVSKQSAGVSSIDIIG